jgi:uncharacterized membrane protein
MDTVYLLDWANLLLRWAHVITAIAWVGSSFYFVFLDNSLTRPTAPDLLAKGVDGELWAVHGGGFYHPQKYMVSPPQLPEHLHWFYWESYSTWLTGFALFTVMYLFNAGSFLVDASVHAWSSPGPAIAAALGFLLLFWLAYDGVCRLFGDRPGGDRVVALAALVLVAAASWAACRLFPGRAAFLLVGAMMATAMSANVLFWIIPGQRKVVAQLRAGQAPDPVHGRRGKQRSVHNTYFTLPVLVAMLSNHYGFLTQGERNWAVLLVLMAAGALIRHFFVARHKAKVQGRQPPWAAAAAGVLLIAALVAWLAPAPAPRATAAAPAPTLAQVQTVVEQRCVMCHNAQLANKGVALHTPALIEQHRQQIVQQAVLQRTMPLNNATGITEPDRALLARWAQAAAAAASR